MPGTLWYFGESHTKIDLKFQNKFENIVIQYSTEESTVTVEIRVSLFWKSELTSNFYDTQH